MVKASAGGGGKGIRIVKEASELAGAVRQAQAEAEAAFGNGAVYVEKYIGAPRHIEIQVLADGQGHGVHLGERDCSIQRRHQKLIEEAPSPAVGPELRAQMGEAAVAAAVAAHYEGAGTVEFLLDADGSFYFMEMNTRVQVEHCVTEMVSGVDIVKTGIRIAAGEGLPLRQEDIELEGHAIEFRINAEDPAENFMPSPGVVTQWIPPGGPWVRLDSHVYQGYLVPPFYDSLLGKLIVWGRDREECLARSRWALDQFLVDGVKTVIPFHRLVIDHPLFVAGDVNTHFIEDHLELTRERRRAVRGLRAPRPVACRRRGADAGAAQSQYAGAQDQRQCRRGEDRRSQRLAGHGVRHMAPPGRPPVPSRTHRAVPPARRRRGRRTRRRRSARAAAPPPARAARRRRRRSRRARTR